ncbi:YkgJ family cysteine cluster protein [Marinobacter sp.]|uniref:YkgJ family cysteine cluster protein n=1 Tax=Marinobacter sp. TaxID=50741 RepID=UPI003A90E131
MHCSDKKKYDFPCTRCGLCCQHVDKAPQTRHLDRGDGTCLNYDPAKKACSIYSSRPEICRVDVQYAKHYSRVYSWDDFVEINLQACELLTTLADEPK